MTKVNRQPLAFGMTRWGPLPETMDLFLFWGGPGDGLFLEKGMDGPQKKVESASGRGPFTTLKQAQAAVNAMVAEFEEGDGDD